MKALMKYEDGIGKVDIFEIDEPIPGNDEVKIKVEYAGICGTDLHIYNNEYKHNPPVTLGHEFSGTVVDLGDNVKDIMIGDRVTAEGTIITCGKCLYCRTGDYNLCNQRKSIGIGTHGAFAKYIVTKESKIHKLPDNISLEEGALSEPVAVAVHALLDDNNITAQDIVIIGGPGTIGLLCLQIAKIAGAFTVITGLRSDTKRLQLAQDLGADLIINLEDENFIDRINNINNEGADVYVECSGAGKAVSNGFDALRKKGKYLQLGLFSEEIKVDFQKIVTKEINVKGYFAHNYLSWETAMKVLAGNQLKIKPLISEVLPLSSWRKGFESFKTKDNLKTLLTPED
jgi:L-iditol 2-dehydrogenase